MKSPQSSCQCVNGNFVCFFADACLLPRCVLTNWDFLVNEECDFATRVIKAEFPGMVVDCVTEQVMETTSSQDKSDRNRMFLVVDDYDIVIVTPKVG